MSTWKKPVSGSFDDAAKWNPNGVPGSNELAAITAGGAAYTVTSTGDSVMQLALGSSATLFVKSGTFAVSYIVSSAGLIKLGTGATLALGGYAPSAHFANAKQITLAASATLDVSKEVILEGSGALKLGGGTIGSSTGGDLVNLGNTIFGVGAIGGGGLTFSFYNGAKGVVDASGASLASETLTINTAAAVVVNDGLIESTGAGALVIDSSIDDEGRLLASGTGVMTIADGANITGGGVLGSSVAGAEIDLDNARVILDGQISTVKGSRIVAIAGTTDVIEGLNIANSGSIVLQAHATLDLGGDIAGGLGSAIDLNGATLVVTDGAAALLGQGKVVLGAGGGNSIVSDGSTEDLYNFSQTISGEGVIGDAHLRFVNLAGGTVNANLGGRLTLFGDTNDASRPMLNAGLIENTGGGGLSVVNAFKNAGNVLENGTGMLDISGALDNEGKLNAKAGLLRVDGNVTGFGTVSISGAGEIEFVGTDNEDVYFAAGSQGVLRLDDGHDAFAFSGEIHGFAPGDAIDLSYVHYASVKGPYYSGFLNQGTLEIGDASMDIAEIQLYGGYKQSLFVLSADANGGTVVKYK